MSSLYEGVVVTLLANGDEQTVVRAGDPLVLTVSVVNAAGMAAGNRNAVNAHTRVKLENDMAAGRISRSEYEKELRLLAAKKVTTVQLGSARSPWSHGVRFFLSNGSKERDLSWKWAELIHPSARPVVKLGETGSSWVDCGFDPEELTKQKAGTFRIRAAIDLQADKIESGEVKVELRSDGRSKTAVRTRALATYQYRRGTYDRAFETAMEALRRKPDDIVTLILLGDIEMARQATEMALRYYEQALREYRRQRPDSTEEPRSLLSKIRMASQA